jgi:hypothetical protein
MAWRLTGSLIESCSCNMFCPCWFLVPDVMIMDQGWCASTDAFRLQAGDADGVNLGGLTVVFAIDFPGPTMFDGNAKARVYIDDGASADQRRELEAIFQGQKGGPMAMLSPLISNWLPTQAASIAIREDGDNLTISVGSAGELRSRLLRDQGGQGFELSGGGFISALNMPSVALAPSSSSWRDADLRTFETKSGARGNFSWSG